MNIWFFIVPFVIAAALPGPAQGALVAKVLGQGARATLPFVAGMVAGNAIWLMAAVFGLAALALRFEPLFVVIKWCGVAYLLFVARQLWRAPAAPFSGEKGTAKGAGAVPGLLLTLGNPKAVIFFGAVLPHAFDLTTLTADEIAFIAMLGIAIDASVEALYVAVAARARSLVRSARAMRLVNRSAAGLMAGSATMIAARA